VVCTVLLGNDLGADAKGSAIRSGGVQLTVYALMLMAVIMWRPTGIMGYLAGACARRAEIVSRAGDTSVKHHGLTRSSSPDRGQNDSEACAP